MLMQHSRALGRRCGRGGAPPPPTGPALHPTRAAPGQHLQHQQARSRRRSVVARFKEGPSQEEDELIARRRKQEEVIQRQEGELAQPSQQRPSGRGSLFDPIPPTEVSPGRLSDSPSSPLALPGWFGSSGGLKGYARNAFRAPLLLLPVFSRRREMFISRLAMLGFAGVLLSEALVAGHPGVVGQCLAWTGLEPGTIRMGFKYIAGYYVLGGLGPWSPTFSPDNMLDIAKRPEGPPTQLAPPLPDLGRTLGCSAWGFTKRNEIFNGRVAMLAFLACYLAEGPADVEGISRGPLALLAANLGIAVDDHFYGVTVPLALLSWTGLLIALSFVPGLRSRYHGQHEYDMY